MRKQYVEFEYEVDKFSLGDIATETVSGGGLDENSSDFATDDFDF